MSYPKNRASCPVFIRSSTQFELFTVGKRPSYLENGVLLIEHHRTSDLSSPPRPAVPSRLGEGGGGTEGTRHHAVTTPCRASRPRGPRSIHNLNKVTGVQDTNPVGITQVRCYLWACFSLIECDGDPQHAFIGHSHYSRFVELAKPLPGRSCPLCAAAKDSITAERMRNEQN